jgi:hypothetical protein
VEIATILLLPGVSGGFAGTHNAFASMVHDLSVAVKTAIG